MNKFDAVNQLLGKHRFGPMDNAMLTKAILATVKRSEEIDRQPCGHDATYFEAGECNVCKTLSTER